MHLGLASDSLQRQGGVRLRPTAFYNVCRAALIAASQALWVMTGTEQERLRRVQLLELDEAKSAKAFLTDYADDVAFESDTSEEIYETVKTRLAQEAAEEPQIDVEASTWRGHRNLDAQGSSQPRDGRS